jgi:hypothetical protein
LAFWWWVLIPSVVGLTQVRGVVDGLGMPVHGADLERAMFGGVLPSAWLQDRLLSVWPEGFSWASVVVHASWFFVPWLAAVLVTVKRRERMGSFARWWVGLQLISVALFALVPLAPPWMADPDVTRVISLRFGEIQDANPVAALPSLHVALPVVLGLWFLRQEWRLPGRLLLGYAAVVSAEVVFSGEHYVIDIVAAVAVACAVSSLARLNVSEIAGRLFRAASSSRTPREVQRLEPALNAVAVERPSERGQAIIEMILVLPLLFLFIMVLVDFGVAMDRREVIQHAVREGTRKGAVGWTVDDIKDYTASESQGVLEADDVDVCYVDIDASGLAGNAGDAVRVSATYVHEFNVGSGELLAVFGVDAGLWDITMTPEAQGLLEQTVLTGPECS